MEERSWTQAYGRKKCLEATPRLELGIKALQASALPLGHVAVTKKASHA